MSCCWSAFAVLSVLALSALAPAVSDAAPSDGLLDVQALAARIDHFLAVRQMEKTVQPAPRSDDTEFLRRVYLDLAGCIPAITDVRDFLDDTRSDKRRLWVDMLLDGQKPSRKPDAFSQHFANVWRQSILSHVDKADHLVATTEKWLQERLKENTPYDHLVRQMIMASPRGGNDSASSGFFYEANGFKAENLAANTSRLFLGVKLECAQCHEDRSGGSWTQKQFWSFAAFFAGTNPQGRLQIEIPGKKKVVHARFLDGAAPVWKSGDEPRALLADWLVNAQNPYFARTAVNRLWAYLFGIGLVDPVDGQGEHNPPSHPELLDELARQFAGHGFDLKYLIRALVASQAYQRTSLAGHGGSDDPRLFARMAIRGLSAEQLFDSLAEATELPSAIRVYSNRFDNGLNLSPRQQFLSRFAQQGKPTEVSTSILQALYLMNNSLVTDRTSVEQNQMLASLAEQKTPDARRVETLFLVVLSRKPTAWESRRVVAYLTDGGGVVGRRQALADVFWALLNSAEFSVNH